MGLKIPFDAYTDDDGRLVECRGTGPAYQIEVDGEVKYRYVKICNGWEVTELATGDVQVVSDKGEVL